MATQRYSRDDLWRNAVEFWIKKEPFYSLVCEKRYQPIEINHSDQKLKFRYERGNPYSIIFNHLYKFYEYLYSQEEIKRNYFRNEENCKHVFGWKCWHAPGAAMYALLPHLDDNIRASTQGDLSITNPSFD